MLKLIRLTAKKTRTDQGFSMLEVLVASLIAFGFLMGSLQAIVLAVALRVEAQEKQIASQLIQKEIENINREATILDQNGTNYDVQTSKCLASAYSNGYAQALWNAYTASTSYQATPTQKLLIGTGSSGEDQGKELGLISIDQYASSKIPHKTLRIRYEVREWDDSTSTFDLSSDPIAEDYIEVIPNAALQCP
jgi:Tfp pilus assembly protein PilV